MQSGESRISSAMVTEIQCTETPNSGLIGAIGSIFERYKYGKLSYVNCRVSVLARRSRKLN